MNSQQKTVLLLTTEFGQQIVGGLGRHVNDLVEIGSKQNLQFVVMTISFDDKESYTVEEGVHIFRLLPWKKRSTDFIDFIKNMNFRMTQFILQELQLSFDLIHIHDWMLAFVGCHIKKELHKPLITTFHSTEKERKQYNNGEILSIITQYENLLLHDSDRIIVCSRYMEKIIEHKIKGRNVKPERIPNGIVAENYQSTLDHKQALSRFPFLNSPYLLAMGRLVKEKGFQLLIESIIKIHKEVPGFKLVIVGEGPFEEHLKQMVKEAQLERYVFFTGFLEGEERNTLLHFCHLFVVPSLYEPFGIVALEAMLFRKAVVSFNIGGLKEVLANNRGVLVKQLDSQSLANHLLYCLLHPIQMNKIATEGYNAVMRDYQWEKLIKKTINIYDISKFDKHL